MAWAVSATMGSRRMGAPPSACAASASRARMARVAAKPSMVGI